MNYGRRFVTLYREQESRPSPVQRKREKQTKKKWLSEKALQRTLKRSQDKSKGEKERFIYLNAELQRTSWSVRKSSLAINAKK